MASLREALSNQETLRIVRTPVIKSKNPVIATPKVKRPTILHEIFRQRFQKRSVYYFTHGRSLKPGKMRDFTKERSPYWFPPEEEEFTYREVYKVWRERFRKEEAKYKYFNRPSYRSRQTEDLLERLYISDEDAKPPKVPGILDIDPEFFSIIAGRPVKDDVDKRTYLATVQDTLMTRLRTGYVMDNVLQLDEQNHDEQDQIDLIAKEHKFYLDSFEEFLSKDYHTSMEFLSNLETHLSESREKEIVSRELQRDVGLLRSRLYNLEEQWRDCKIYQTFLYKVAPLEWREKNDYINFSKDGKRDSQDVFGRYRLTFGASLVSLDGLIEMFLADIKDEQPPLLYFTDPLQLTTIFQNMEHRNLNSVLFGEEIRVPLEELQTGLVEFREQIHEELSTMEDRILDLERLIAYEEGRVQSLRDLSQDLIHNKLKRLVISDDILHLTIFIENAYTDVVKQKDTGKTSLNNMMRTLETTLGDLWLQLDFLPGHIVNQAEFQVFEEQTKSLKEAKEAWKKKLIIDGMFSSLSKALGPIYHRTGKEVKPRSAPPPMRKKLAPVEELLTEDQQDTLDFYTDFCHHLDDQKKVLDGLDLGFDLHPKHKPVSSIPDMTQQVKGN